MKFNLRSYQKSFRNSNLIPFGIGILKLLQSHTTFFNSSSKNILTSWPTSVLLKFLKWKLFTPGLSKSKNLKWLNTIPITLMTQSILMSLAMMLCIPLFLLFISMIALKNFEFASSSLSQINVFFCHCMLTLTVERKNTCKEICRASSKLESDNLSFSLF